MQSEDNNQPKTEPQLLTGDQKRQRESYWKYPPDLPEIDCLVCLDCGGINPKARSVCFHCGGNHIVLGKHDPPTS